MKTAFDSELRVELDDEIQHVHLVNVWGHKSDGDELEQDRFLIHYADLAKVIGLLARVLQTGKGTK